MKNASNAPLLVFAHVPPPEHGQSRMIATMLEALEGGPEVVHVDARYSDEMADVGSTRIGKLFMVLGYVWQALVARWSTGGGTLYYVPGPASWAAVLRDWVVLALLRPWYPDLVLHWHAIGQGEWAAGGARGRLSGPRILDRVARRISRFLLRKPVLSIVVSETSDADARAVESARIEVVCNGIDDPCSGYGDSVAPRRRACAEELREGDSPEIRVLFLSHGSEEKGLTDALAAVEEVAKLRPGRCRLSVTIAGGVASELREWFDGEVGRLNADAGLELVVRPCGFVVGDDKARCFSEADLFLAPSRWESFGLTVVEAMAWGVPVVAASSDGVRGILSDDYDWFAAPGDVGELTGVLDRGVDALLRGDGEEWGMALRRRFEERYGSDVFCREIRRVVESLCDRAETDA